MAICCSCVCVCVCNECTWSSKAHHTEVKCYAVDTCPVVCSMSSPAWPPFPLLHLAQYKNGGSRQEEAGSGLLVTTMSGTYLVSHSPTAIFMSGRSLSKMAVWLRETTRYLVRGLIWPRLIISKMPSCYLPSVRTRETKRNTCTHRTAVGSIPCTLIRFMTLH